MIDIGFIMWIEHPFMMDNQQFHHEMIWTITQMELQELVPQNSSHLITQSAPNIPVKLRAKLPETSSGKIPSYVVNPMPQTHDLGMFL